VSFYTSIYRASIWNARLVQNCHRATPSGDQVFTNNETFFIYGQWLSSSRATTDSNPRKHHGRGLFESHCAYCCCTNSRKHRLQMDFTSFPCPERMKFSSDGNWFCQGSMGSRNRQWTSLPTCSCASYRSWDLQRILMQRLRVDQAAMSLMW
jgi:hypothetical protein